MSRGPYSRFNSPCVNPRLQGDVALAHELGQARALGGELAALAARFGRALKTTIRPLPAAAPGSRRTTS